MQGVWGAEGGPQGNSSAGRIRRPEAACGAGTAPALRAVSRMLQGLAEERNAMAETCRYR